VAADTIAPVQAVHLKRALGVWDLTWLCVVAVLNLNVVPVIAANGPITLWLWLASLALFFLPQGIAVIDLSHRFPNEGGLYVWTKEMYGDLHGFLCGWSYWTSNLFFIPTLLFYLVGIVTYMGGKTAAGFGENRLFFFLLTVGLLWLTAWANIRGLGVGKWVNNAGGIGALIGAAILIALGALTLAHAGVRISARSLGPGALDWRVVSSFGIICFGLVGLELGPVMGDEIREPRRSIPRGILLGGLLAGTFYLGATLAVLLAIPQNEIQVVQGVLQGIDKMAAQIGLGWVLYPLALLISVSIVGSTSAWLSGSARIIFVSGLDRYMPKILGKVHRRYGTPHIALVAIAAMSSLLVAMSFAGGTTVREAYVTLLDLAVVVQMISYLYLFAALARVAFEPGHGPGFYSKARIRFAAAAGLLTTTIGLVVAFIPSHQVSSIWRFELKMFLTTAVFMGLAAGLFFYYRKKI